MRSSIRVFRKARLFVAAVAIGATALVGAASAETGESKEEIALSLARLLLAARSVVSDNQALINDHTKGYKGFTAKVVIDKTKEAYENETGDSVDEVEKGTLHARLLQAELDAIAEVVTEAQARINRKGVAFKGFLPTIFAVDVAAKFSEKVGKVAEIHVTAPERVLRNRANRPDKWESEVIDDKFVSPDHPMGEHVYGEHVKAGKAAFRLIVPEYYVESCLACHGDPKGRRDITGYVKEGAKLGDLGGAISVVLYDN